MKLVEVIEASIALPGALGVNAVTLVDCMTSLAGWVYDLESLLDFIIKQFVVECYIVQNCCIIFFFVLLLNINLLLLLLLH